MLTECPSIYELMANPDFSWDFYPLVQMWRETHDDSGSSGSSGTLLESYQLTESLPSMKEALLGNMVEVDGKQLLHLPLNLQILKWANETRNILQMLRFLQQSTFTISMGLIMTHPIVFAMVANKHLFKELLLAPPNFICVNGDGTVPAESAMVCSLIQADYFLMTTVPAESAKADGLHAVARVGVPANHRGIIADHRVLRILKQWLKAGEPDPFYDPLNDYVILPTAFEVEKYVEQGLQVTTLKEDCEIISLESNDATNNKSVDSPSFVDALSVTVGKKQPFSEAQASVVHPQCEGVRHVEVRVVNVTASG